MHNSSFPSSRQHLLSRPPHSRPTQLAWCTPQHCSRARHSVDLTPLHCTTSHHIFFHHILSYLILSCLILSCLILSCPVLSCPVSSLATTLRQSPTPPRCVHTPSARGHTRGHGVGMTPCVVVVVRIMVRMVMVRMLRMLVCVHTVMLKVIL